MNLVLTSLFCIAFGSIIQAGWITEQPSVKEDAAELTRLYEEFWALKPDIVYEEGPLVVCQFIDQCCEKEEDRSRAISTLMEMIETVGSALNDEKDEDEDSYKKIINQCVNTTDLQESIRSCPPIRRFLYPVITEKEKLDFIEYSRIFLNWTETMDNLINYETDLCNQKELYAVFCLSDTQSIKHCVSKNLQKIYDRTGSYAYQKLVIEAKQNLTTIYQQSFQLQMKRMHKEVKPFLRTLSKYYSTKH